MKACAKEAHKRGKLAKPRLDVIKLTSGVMPNQCRQCDDAPCAKVCPSTALRNMGGYVEVYERLCIGCSLCTVACPYGAIELVSEEVASNGLAKNEYDVCGDGYMSVAVKCDICDGRAAGSACVEACPKGALVHVKPQSGKHKYGAKLKDAEKMSSFIADILGCEPPVIETAASKPKPAPKPAENSENSKASENSKVLENSADNPAPNPAVLENSNAANDAQKGGE